MMSIEERMDIHDLFADYGTCLDEDRLEEWLELFSVDCTYKIVPRDNYDLNLPVTLMLCENRNMLRDRIVSLREANQFTVHRDRRLISNIKIKQSIESEFLVTGNYVVYQADREGSGSLFSFGFYDSTIIFVSEKPKFYSMMVVVDNWAIPHMLSTPI